MNTEYSDDPRARPLRRSELDADPLRQFEGWFAEAGRAVAMPEAVALATAAADGTPSARMVLVKRADERGFVFHTNYESRKGRELADNPRAALLFYWHELGRQVRIEGRVERVEAEESDAYFRTRPRGGQLAAVFSAQSEVIDSRAELEAAIARNEGKREIARPAYWGGYRLVPEVYEFWQHRENRLHDRFRYRREDGAWVIERLSP
jgi:pyridoxamine 5'-phosphate oxidase